MIDGSIVHFSLSRLLPDYFLFIYFLCRLETQCISFSSTCDQYQLIHSIEINMHGPITKGSEKDSA